MLTVVSVTALLFFVVAVLIAAGSTESLRAPRVLKYFGAEPTDADSDSLVSFRGHIAAWYWSQLKPGPDDDARSAIMAIDPDVGAARIRESAHAMAIEAVRTHPRSVEWVGIAVAGAFLALGVAFVLVLGGTWREVSGF